VCHLCEAEGVTASLVEMGAVLSPATYAILSGAQARAEKAHRRAEALAERA